MNKWELSPINIYYSSLSDCNSVGCYIINALNSNKLNDIDLYELGQSGIYDAKNLYKKIKKNVSYMYEKE